MLSELLGVTNIFRTIAVTYSANPDPPSLSIVASLPSLCQLPVRAANFSRMKSW
jgi:hypothetical protein